MLMSRLLKGARMLPGLVSEGWTRQYEDARIILEQNGDLHYLNLSARVQRYFVRGGILLTGIMLAAILVLLVTSVNLMISRARLERSHEEVYRALLSSAVDAETGEQVSMNDEQMLALAQTIRDRDMSIRRFVDTSMVAVSRKRDHEVAARELGPDGKNHQDHPAKRSQRWFQRRGGFERQSAAAWQSG